MNGKAGELAIDDPATLAEVTSHVARYEAALMANDFAVLDELFRHSPLTRRFGATEQLYGFEAIAAYRRDRPGGAPPRRILRQSITTYGTDFATADIEFQPIGTDRLGRQTQSWVRTGKGWRVVSAHVSFMSVPD
ncbi:oxalurate catabolism protein HpxZ [Lichenicola cladoniae]|uniref:Oxalurate catabolism protein HpxZ n=1 Tax=Lichenicola cladoniae TaxID=1484109 RepID=A0A6M8HNQ7_9PROT|nr:oxalurate catabolism protein HpxZ [Lichenicola cladoniae]NPD67420.1 oxalurate catabolism protein HpxZ [Acetobacteraceae bacterium]QKE89911.1 oxalurate catabolism protein HpxZ [Lichenicola cladoniae]